MDLINHLMDWYDKITPINIKDNKDQMYEVIVTSQLIDVYFKRIDDSVQFTAGGKTIYTTEQILHTVYNATLITGLYSDKMKAWCLKMVGDKTWENFKIPSPKPTTKCVRKSCSPCGQTVSSNQIMPSILAPSWIIWL